MADIVISVSIQVLKKTSIIVADLIVKEGSRFSKMQEEIFWLEREMRHIQSYLKYIENKRAESEGMANLIRDIRDLAFDVEDTMDKHFYPSPKLKGLKGFFKRIPRTFSDFYSNRNFLLEIESIKRRVEDLNRVRQSYGIDEKHSDQVGGVERDDWNERRSFPHIEEPNITGFENHTRDLVSNLDNNDSSLRVISITGMPGLGKTTLAKKVYNSVQRNFQLTAWIYVSEQPIIKRILQDIARQVGLKIGNWENGGEASLYQHLRLHNYLLVFDDIWHTKTWDAIKNVIPTGSQNRNRIILTSRHRDVGVHVGGWSSLYELKPLEENYSKQLFHSSLGVIETEDDPPGLQEIGERILHRCGGVPLAIVVISGLLKLRERLVTAWNGVLELMERDSEEYLSKTYTLSYMDLPVNLKPCFLYFGMFPEDQEIDKLDLINLWVAEGFIKGSQFREVEEVGDDYLNCLVARNLIQVVRKDVDGKVRSFRIHDIFHNLCVQVAKDINFFTTSGDLIHSNFRTVRRVVHGMGLNDNISLQTSRIRSFLCFKGLYLNLYNRKSRRAFFKFFNLTRVLYFEELISPIFAKEIWSLKNLTYLKLKIVTSFEITESIIFLENLVTLDLQADHPSLDKLAFPMVIWNMKQLRHLLLSKYLAVRPTYIGFDPNAIQFENFRSLQGPPDIFDWEWLPKFSKLRKLIFNRAGSGFVYSCGKVAKLILCSTLVLNKLETLQFSGVYGPKLQVATLKMSRYQNLINLFLEFVRIEQWPESAELPPNLTKVVLRFCVLKEDPLQVMKKMPKLRALKLLHSSYASGKLICSGEPGNFPQLRHLYILTDSISEITIEDGGMSKLEEFITMGSRVKLNVPTTTERIWRHLPHHQRLINKIGYKCRVCKKSSGGYFGGGASGGFGGGLGGGGGYGDGAGGGFGGGAGGGGGLGGEHGIGSGVGGGYEIGGGFG